MTAKSQGWVNARVRQAFDQTMLDAVPLGALIIGVVYGVLVPIYALSPPKTGGGLLVGVALVTAVLLIGLWVGWRRHPPPADRAQRWGALILGVVLTNNTLFLALFPEPRFAGTLAVVLLAAGWFFLTPLWYTLAVGATAGAFALTVLRAGPESNWFGPLILLIAAGGLSTVVRASRSSTLRRLELLRIENEEQARERQRAEAVLRRNQKLESLAIMAGGIAHDFNNLLAVMIGNADLVLWDLAPDAKESERLRDVIDAGARATRLTGQLLTFTGRGLQKLETVNLSAQVVAMAELLESSLATKVSLRFDLGEVGAVDADLGQLQQVVMNLVLNAGHALTTRGSEICLRTRVTDLSEEDLPGLEPVGPKTAGPYVVLEVVDDGCGMDPQVLERIFDPFFTTRSDGRGLGLAAVLGILRAHGGGLSVASTPGEGTRFQVYFPASQHPLPPSISAQPALTPRIRPGAGALVLVIDDEALVRHLAVRALEKLGWGVVEAASGPDGIDALRQGGSAIRCCLLDMNMPGLSGEDTLHALREFRPDLPVLLTSGYSEESVAPLLLLGQTAFLEKPYELSMLSKRLYDLLGDEMQRPRPSTS